MTLRKPLEISQSTQFHTYPFSLCLIPIQFTVADEMNKTIYKSTELPAYCSSLLLMQYNYNGRLN